MVHINQDDGAGVVMACELDGTVELVAIRKGSTL